MKAVPSNWYENFFHGVTLDLWRKAIPPERTKAEAEFLFDQLNCSPAAHVLDVPCGNGRLSFELAKRGFRVTGVDISTEFINEALNRIKEQPPATAGGSDLAFILGDMRRLDGENIYDGAYCFGNSFAFLEYSDMKEFLRGVARALKPGARFLIETGMAAESVLPSFQEQSSHEFGDLKLTITERYLAGESCIESEYRFERDGQSETRRAKEWIYTAAEIRRMLELAGFDVLDIYGSLKLEPYELGSQELFVVAQTR